MVDALDKLRKGKVMKQIWKKEEESDKDIYAKAILGENPTKKKTLAITAILVVIEIGVMLGAMIFQKKTGFHLIEVLGVCYLLEAFFPWHEAFFRNSPFNKKDEGEEQQERRKGKRHLLAYGVIFCIVGSMLFFASLFFAEYIWVMLDNMVGQMVM
jgi:hypothetical protein